MTEREIASYRELTDLNAKMSSLLMAHVGRHGPAMPEVAAKETRIAREAIRAALRVMERAESPPPKGEEIAEPLEAA